MFSYAVPAGAATDGPETPDELETPETPETPDEPETPDGSGSPDSSRDATEQASVRPPDLSPQEVRDEPEDVLAGWDLGASEVEIAAWRRDERPFPADTIVVAGAGVLGLLLGGWFAAGHRVRAASIGAGVGLVAAAGVRRIWRLQS